MLAGYKNKFMFGCSLVCLCLLGGASIGQVPPGSSSVMITDPGMAGPTGYYRDFGQVMPDRRGMQDQQQQVMVLIKQGTKIYCAWSNQLIHNDVTFLEVTPEQASQFYDDGTHNDEIPFDGLPSNVVINNYQYLSPYAIAIRERMEGVRERVLTVEDADQIKVARWYQEGKWEPLRFYAGFHVASLDRKTDLPRFSDKLADMTEYIHGFDQDYIEQLRGYEYYPDREFPQWERQLWTRQEPRDPAVRREMGFDRRRRQEMEMDQFGYPGMMGAYPGMMYGDPYMMGPGAGDAMGPWR